MTFEDQLTRAFETLTERLRGDIDLQVQRTSAELVAAAPYLGDRDASDVQSIADEMAIVVAAARREAHEEGLAAGREAGRQEALDDRARQTVDEASRERLAGALRSLDGARSLTAILDTLVGCARTEAAGADVWLVRGRRLHQWRSPGCDEAGADHLPAGSVSEKCEHAPSRPAPPRKDDPNSHVVPREARLLGAREPLLRRAPRSLDEGGVIAQAARTGAVASTDGTLAVPIAIAGQVVAVLFADLSEPRRWNVEPRTSNVEFLARYAARCLEALTAFTAARALTKRPGEPDAADLSPPAIDEASAEDDTSARRYARLLVSEIKLYHESAVADGRRDRDLATRLGGEIARARAMYEQRVPPHVRQRADFFHDELVRTLANGDASLLEVRT